jgi:hypothetical protein
MKIRQQLSFAFTGWIAGTSATLGLGLLWPSFFPAIVRVEHYYGAGPGLTLILALVLIWASPAALAGGLIGSRLPREGGQREQMLIAAILGVLLALPFGCWGFWFFTGW